MPRKPTDDDERVRALAGELTEEAAHEAAADAALVPSVAARMHAERWRALLASDAVPDDASTPLAVGSTDDTPSPGDASSAGIPVAWLAYQARIDAREVDARDDPDHDGTPEGEVEAMEREAAHEAALAEALSYRGPPSDAGRRLGSFARTLARDLAEARAAPPAARDGEGAAVPRVEPVEDTARLLLLSRSELVARFHAAGLHVEPDALAQLDKAGLVARLREAARSGKA